MVHWLFAALPTVALVAVTVAVYFYRRALSRARKLTIEAWTAYRTIDDELERTAWSLGGRLRDKDQPPIYAMPPGQESVKSCDEARVAWMECAHAASVVMREHGLDDEADKIHCVTVKANTMGLGQTKLDPKSITGSMG